MEGQTGPVKGSGGWITFPLNVCSYFKKGTCLRVGCHFFHGTDQLLHEFHSRGATLYRVNDGSVHYGATHKPPSVKLPTNSAAAPAGPPCQTATGIASKEPAEQSEPAVVACLSFLSGTCSRLDCRFVHLKSNIRLLPTHVCAYQSSPRGCQKGHQCRYFHGSLEQLNVMKEKGIVMFNPFTNEPYEKLPDKMQLEDASSREQPAQPPPVMHAHHVQYAVPTGIVMMQQHQPYLMMQQSQLHPQLAPPVNVVYGASPFVGQEPMQQQQQRAQPSALFTVIPSRDASQQAAQEETIEYFVAGR